MKLRSGLEYTFVPLLAQRRTASTRKRAVTWRRFVKSHLKALGNVFSVAARAQSIVPELTRFMIKYRKSSSKVHWTKKWATESLARRFVSAGMQSRPTNVVAVAATPPLQSESPFSVSFRTVAVTYSWKDVNAVFPDYQFDGPEMVYLKTELFRKRGELFRPFSTPVDHVVEREEWEMVYRTPPGSLDARFRLSVDHPCSFPCYCRVHLPNFFKAEYEFGRLVRTTNHECISCVNFVSEAKMCEVYPGGFYTSEGAFDQHLLNCKSQRARGYRRRKLRYDRVAGFVSVNDKRSLLLGNRLFDEMKTEY